MNEIRDFEPLDLSVVSVDGFLVEIHLGSTMPRIGELVRVGHDVLRVIRHNGQRRATAQSLGRHVVKVGQSVELTHQTACFPAPMPFAEVAEVRWQTDGVDVHPKRPGMFELLGDLKPACIGHQGLDAIAPVPIGGAMLIGQSGTAAVKRAIASVSTASTATIAVNTPLEAGFQIKGDAGYLELMAWRMGTAWAAHLRQHGDVILVGRLPVRAEEPSNRVAAESGGTTLSALVDMIVDTAASTRGGAITTLLHLDVSPTHNLHPILETLSTGSIDAIWIFDSEGRPELSRCTSRVADGQTAIDTLSALSSWAKQEERRAMGLVDPEDDESLADLSELTAPLLDVQRAAN